MQCWAVYKHFFSVFFGAASPATRSQEAIRRLVLYSAASSVFLLVCNVPVVLFYVSTSFGTWSYDVGTFYASLLVGVFSRIGFSYMQASAVQGCVLIVVCLTYPPLAAFVEMSGDEHHTM